MQVRSPLELEKQCQVSFRVDIRIVGFLLRCQRPSQYPSFFESILGVTVESVQFSQVYLEGIGTSGSFAMVARPLEFLSRVKLRPPPLVVQWECLDSFPNEGGKETSSRDEQGNPGLFLSCGGTLSVPLECRQVCWGTS